MEQLKDRIKQSLENNRIAVRTLIDNSDDLSMQNIKIGQYEATILKIEGMTSSDLLAEFFMAPLRSLQPMEPNAKEFVQSVLKTQLFAGEQKEVFTYDEVFTMLFSGFVVLMIEGADSAIAFGMQGFQVRGISEPASEMNVKGSRESFVESARINMTMVRRRIKNTSLKFSFMKIGSVSQTEVILCYMTDKVSKDLLNEVKKRLSDINLDVLLDSAYLQPYIDSSKNSLFSGVGFTERPDTLCGKIKEGRIGLIVDGTPFSMVVPYFFNEHFQSIDDYSNIPYYASFVRILKYVAFFISTLLPGLFVAIAQFHLELMPKGLLLTVVETQGDTIFSLMFEAIVIFIIYEVLKEAGLRLPRAVGHTVSIIGALLIGEAAVNAGILSAPMIIVVALTAISSFVVPSLYDQVTLLRFLFIVLGGIYGLFGVAVGLLYFFLNITTINSFSIPFTSPIIPFKLKDMKDVLIRANWTKLSKDKMNVKNLPGSGLDDKGDNKSE